MKTKIMLLTGIPGSGKTTLLQKAVQACPTLMVVNYGDEMVEIAAGQKIDRDSMRKLPLFEQQSIELLAAEKIRNKAKGLTIVDTHALIKTPVGFMPGFPKKILNVLNPIAIFVVETDSKILFERRNQDKTRLRDGESIEKIEQHQCLSHGFVAACCVLTGAAIIPIHNNAEPHLAVQQLVEAVNFFKTC